MIRTGLSQLYVTIPQNCFSFSTVFVSKKNSVFFLLFFFIQNCFSYYKTVPLSFPSMPTGARPSSVTRKKPATTSRMRHGVPSALEARNRRAAETPLRGPFLPLRARGPPGGKRAINHRTRLLFKIRGGGTPDPPPPGLEGGFGHPPLPLLPFP